MSEKTMIIVIVSLLGVGFLSVLLVAVPWISGHGASSWKQWLIDDAIVIVAIGLFVFGFYANTKMD
jgi:hypothetical protein